MILLEDLDTSEGLEKWRQCCGAAHACTPALRFYTAQAKAGATLRQAIERTAAAETDQGWLLWQLDAFGREMAPDFRLWLMKQCIDPGSAANLYRQASRGILPFTVTDAEADWLRANAEHPQLEGAA